MLLNSECSRRAQMGPPGTLIYMACVMACVLYVAHSHFAVREGAKAPRQVLITVRCRVYQAVLVFAMKIVFCGLLRPATVSTRRRTDARRFTPPKPGKIVS